MNATLDFQHIVSKCGHGILTTDLSGKVTHINRAAELILGMDAKALMGQTPPASLFSMAKAAMEAVRSQRGMVSVPGTPKGVPILLTVAPLTENGQVEGSVIGIIEPINAQPVSPEDIQLDQELRQSQALVERLRDQLQQVRSDSVDGVSWNLESQGLVAILEDVEKRVLEKAATHCHSTREMAANLKISQPSIVRRLKKYGISLG
jgi:TyrR family helix-turn-helix protein/PAS domain S-box-containing protein